MFVTCVYHSFSQITMTTGWLLLVVVVASSQSVDSHTTDGEVCDGDELSELKRNKQVMQDYQLLQFETFISRLMSNDSQLLRFQNLISRVMGNNNQTAADNETYCDGRKQSEMQRDIERILDNQQQILQILDNQRQILQILQAQQTTTNKQRTTTNVPAGSNKLEK